MISLFEFEQRDMRKPERVLSFTELNAIVIKLIEII